MKRILVAGIGNAWLRDDGFGGEVVKRLEARGLPEEAAVFEYGVEGSEALTFIAKTLTDRLAARLAGRAVGASRIELDLTLDLRRPVMDLVRRDAISAPRANRPSKHLLGAEVDLQRKYPEPDHHALTRLDRIVDLLGEHLVSAADAQHRRATTYSVDDHLREP